ncbi:hypothetical protein LINGRAHAP2_LOCUS38598, partial [Linum grandiflorum]
MFLRVPSQGVRWTMWWLSGSRLAPAVQALAPVGCSCSR